MKSQLKLSEVDLVPLTTMGASETPTIQTKTIVKGLVAGSVLVLLGVALPFAFEALIGFILNKVRTVIVIIDSNIDQNSIQIVCLGSTATQA